MTTLSLLPHQAREVFDTAHSTVIAIGGLGSGKTLCGALWIMDRAEFDSGQLHGLFCNTVTQLENGVLPEIFRWLDAADIEYSYNNMPPKLWRKEWRERGVRIPPRAGNHRRMLTLRSGLHVLCGTTHNRNFQQYRSLQFGSVRIEECTTGPSLQAVQFIAERVRCGDRVNCAAQHRHQTYLVGNPPDDPSHWIFSYLEAAERAAEKHHPGEMEPREPGTFPLLTQGIGRTILIQSSTYDNEFLGENYATNLAEGYDTETARRRLGGELLRITSGRAAESFSAKNIHTVHYDPNRSVWVMLDFDMEPAVAAFAYLLKRGEYPDEWHREGVDYVGVFGEYVNTKGISVRRLAEEIVRGNRGDGLNYRDAALRGLPLNWDGLGGVKQPFIAYGDATGNQRSKNADNLESSWQIVEQVFREVGTHVDGRFRRLYSRDVAEFNPAPRARMHALCAKFQSATGVISLIIDPRCEQLIADLEQCVWDDEGMHIKKWGKRAGGTLYVRGHLMDAVGYMAHRRYPLGLERPRISAEDYIPRFAGTPLKAPKIGI